ncbi:MAG: hypothetical protein JO316_25320 [Abitibacteriaceae bacterium]|nr:hypothetical protein [Abditibacteriaceae bacterium]MBV9868691.1 hypothetical protein [Abditibacteriaceae bacterium]
MRKYINMVSLLATLVLGVGVAAQAATTCCPNNQCGTCCTSCTKCGSHCSPKACCKK